jgi:D-galactarolactone cycloisomerase
LFEVDRAENPLRTELLVDPLDLTGQSIEIPTDPGLGVTVDREAVESYTVDD